MGLLKVLSVRDWLISHILMVAGLVLITVGLLQDTMVLNVIGIWLFVIGFCLGFSAAVKKLAAK